MQRCAAEAFGTFCLVAAGTGAIVVDGATGGAIGHLGIALAFGLVVVAMIEAVGDRSGAHLNPAVSLGFACAGRFPWREVAPYAAGQLVGALAASALLRLAFPADATLGATLPAFGHAASLAIELLITFLLMVVILSVAHGAKERGTSSALAIGSFVFLAALIAGPLTGASMNPARSLGPALVTGRLEAAWLYVAAPCIGALLAAPCCRWLRGPRCCGVERSGGGERGCS
ncbi:MAG: aquaporin [Planctomycetes bacterium]|nr:aquaporin [Planctomycetota bacterium]